MNRIKRCIQISLLILSLYLLPGCTLQPTFNLSEINSDVQLTEDTDYFKLEPAVLPLLEPGIIFYPGGLVAAEAYLKMLSPIAAAGYEIFVVKMPLDLAVFSPYEADKVIPLLSGSSWAIAGHSLGGAMAARYVNRGDYEPSALILLAAYPANSDSLADESLPVISIYADNDGVTLPEDIEESKVNLPPHTQFLEITGGNHAQFGSYGDQNGDGEATITEAGQHALVTAGIITFLQTL